MKYRYAIRRVINTGNYESIHIEFEQIGDDKEAIIAEVEALMEAKEDEVRAQLGDSNE